MKKSLIWLGPCASFLCLVHCFGTGLIALFAPGLLAMLPDTTGAEATVMAIATVSGFFTLRAQGTPSIFRNFFVAGVALGLSGIAFHNHDFFHVGLAAVGVAPAILMFRRHFLSRNKVPDCCQHEHE